MRGGSIDLMAMERTSRKAYQGREADGRQNRFQRNEQRKNYFSFITRIFSE